MKLNTNRGHFPGTWTAVLAGVSLALSGCGGRTAPVAAPAPPAAQSTERAAPTRPLDLIGKVNGRGWYLPWYTRDPKRPNGPPIPVLIAEAETGEITKHNDNPEIVMRRVHARLFQKGLHTANVDAAKIRSNQEEQVIYGSGGCTIKSLLNPADTVLTADRITWDTGNTRFIAEGHAHVVRKPQDGGLPISQEGGKFVYDMEKNTVTIL